MKNLILLFLVLALLCCNTSKKKTETVQQSDQQVSWAIQFANATMSRFDSLIHYNGAKPKYEYDYAFFGMAIDKLSSTDKKYSDYSRVYIDYFVQKNGTIKGHKTSNYNIDRIRPGNNMLTLYKRTGEKKI